MKINKGMKRLLFIVLLLPIILLISCSNIEDDAKKQMEIAIKNQVLKKAEKNGGAITDFNISDIKTMYKSDSLCVLYCKAYVISSNKKREEANIEYIYLKNNALSKIKGETVIMEKLDSFKDEKSSLLSFAKEMYPMMKSVYEDFDNYMYYCFSKEVDEISNKAGN